MPPYTHFPARRLSRILAAVAIPAFLAACSSSSPRSGGPNGSTRGLERSEAYIASQPTTPPSPDAPLATAADAPITLADLRPALIDLAGAIALEEAALDRALDRESRRVGLAVSAADAERERTLLLESLDESGDAQRRAALLTDLRKNRGLGDARFAALLRRNALLRALVQPEVAITPAAIDQAYTLRYGERIGARIIVVADRPAASEALRRLNAGEPFSDVAARLSTDTSARRGGLIEPINPADPSYPAALRTSLTNLAQGETSQPIAVDNGFAILRREPSPSLAAPPPIDSVRTVIERDARLRQERALMEELARRLLAQAGVTVYDPALNAAWRTRTGR